MASVQVLPAPDVSMNTVDGTGSPDLGTPECHRFTCLAAVTACEHQV